MLLECDAGPAPTSHSSSARTRGPPPTPRDWAKDVWQIAERHTTRIKALLADPDLDVAATFDQFLTGLRANLNDGISRDDAIDMLAQHLITKPVFDALFEGYAFAEHNPVSQVMENMIAALHDQNLTQEQEGLQRFYDSVRVRAEGIDNAEGKQQIITELYEKFFKIAFPRAAESLGIVYPPVEIVDFILRSVEHILQAEFGASLGDEGVHILDPFTGTGTFIARLLQSDGVLTNTQRMATFYNEQVAGFEKWTESQDLGTPTDEDVDAFIDRDSRRISWSRGLKGQLRRGRKLEVDPDRLFLSTYRPFFKQWLYFDRSLNEVSSLLPSIFPEPSAENVGFYISGMGSDRPFSVLATEHVPDIAFWGSSNGQYFPRYVYKAADREPDLFNADVDSPKIDGWARVDNIRDGALKDYRLAYGDTVSADDVFYYAYGILHSGEYRTAFAADLK